MLKCTLSRKEARSFVFNGVRICKANLATESSPLSTKISFCKDGIAEACTPWFPMLRTWFNLNKVVVHGACMFISRGWRFSGGAYRVTEQNLQTSKSTFEG